MRLQMLGLALAAIFVSLPSFPTELCSPIEYAEMKDTPTKSLGVTYCRYQHMKDIGASAMLKLYDLQSRSIAQQVDDSAVKVEIMATKAAVDGCSDQLIKIERTFSLRKVKPPTCPK